MAGGVVSVLWRGGVIVLMWVLIAIALQMPSYSSSGERSNPTVSYAGSREVAVSVALGAFITIGIWRRQE